ncbi:MAG TPA: hypothetical protein VHP32_12140 [Ignavibacteria bacterium]|nr:hypothetical protein [Ignavibacteria bacterium]
MKTLLNDLALIPLFLIIFAVVSPMFTSCSQKGENMSNENANYDTKTQEQRTIESVHKDLSSIPQYAHPAILINNNTSSGVKENVNRKKDDAKKVTEDKNEKKPEVKTEDTKTKDPRMADDTEMDPKNKFPENYNGK